MQEYPKWIYHKTKEAKIVESKEEQDAQGPGWKENPSAFDQKSDETAEKPDEPQESEKQKPGEALKEKDFLKMKVADLKAYLLGHGATEEDLKGLTKDELIAEIGSL